MLIVYIPQSWAHTPPRDGDARPFIAEADAQKAFPDELIVSTPYIGPQTSECLHSPAVALAEVVPFESVAAPAVAAVVPAVSVKSNAKKSKSKSSSK